MRRGKRGKSNSRSSRESDRGQERSQGRSYSPRSPQQAIDIRKRFLDRLFVIVSLILIAIAALLVAALLMVWWDYLESATRPAVQTWAIVATILLIPTAICSVLLGTRLASLRISWFKQDWGEAIRTTMSQVVDAGVDLSDIRVTNARKLFMNEDRRSQDIDMRPSIPELPWRAPQPSEVIEVRAAEVEEA
jgi:hypothetical protein